MPLPGDERSGPFVRPVGTRYLHLVLGICTSVLFGTSVIIAAQRDTSRHLVPEDTTVVERYVRANQLLRHKVLADSWSGDLPSNVVHSIVLFQEITREAPQYANAWAGLAEAEEWAYELDKDHRERVWNLLAQLLSVQSR